MCRLQHWHFGSQFERTENYSNEHCGKINNFSDDEDISKVTNCKFLGVLITNDSYTNEETKKSLSFSKQGMANLTKVGKFWNL